MGDGGGGGTTRKRGSDKREASTWGGGLGRRWVCACGIAMPQRRLPVHLGPVYCPATPPHAHPKRDPCATLSTPEEGDLVDNEAGDVGLPRGTVAGDDGMVDPCSSGGCRASAGRVAGVGRGSGKGLIYARTKM